MTDLDSDRKIKILFVCHGNICRSPMAEYIFRHLARQAGMEERFEVASAAVSSEEIGNDIYPPAKQTLREHGIPFDRHYARRITRADFDCFDHIICADNSNIRWLPEVTPQVSLLMQWTGENRDVSDPWYTRDFDAAYRDILAACKAILKLYTL